MEAQSSWRSRLTQFLEDEPPEATWQPCENLVGPFDPMRQDVRAALVDAEHWRDLFEMASITRNLSFDVLGRLTPLAEAPGDAARLPVACIPGRTKPPEAAQADPHLQDEQWN